MTLKNVTELKEMCEKFYLEYRNNFLSLEKFAEYYEMDENAAMNILTIGRVYNHARPSKYEEGKTK